MNRNLSVHFLNARKKIGVGRFETDEVRYVEIFSDLLNLAAVEVDEGHEVGAVVDAPMGKGAGEPFGAVGGADDHEILHFGMLVNDEHTDAVLGEDVGDRPGCEGIPPRLEAIHQNLPAPVFEQLRLAELYQPGA